MILASLPANCFYVFHHVARSFGHGIRHPLRHPRRVLHHVHRHHVAPPRRWVEIVCKAAHVAGAGTALVLPPAAIVGAAPYVAPYLSPPTIEQGAPYGGGGYAGGGGYPGGGGGMPIYGGLIPLPEEVVLRPTIPQATPPLNGSIIPPYVPPAPPIAPTQTTPQPVPEPSSVVLLAVGFLGAMALSLSKKAAR